MSIYSQLYETQPKHSAQAMGSGGLEVLATPALVAFMEHAAFTLVQNQLKDKQTTVGSEIAIQHLAASKIGQEVTIVITALKEEGRKYDFRIEAFANHKLIGRACHTRVRVDQDAFLEKL
ncbi:thioesterase family protein [Streptococcus equi subsp. zooepidemicus]|uniref:thioesterase family protein n=1 Tax=Streptococcus equi TaxID=1336 RepID=UPI0005B9BF02|nr:thioesterase family protein [Streptococcus equi]KIS14024.1 thioesterase superfamily protein [Streptococcus equi subsp. zooepidemicus SzAM60]MCD3369378.1 thioesterase family protein [Streptococcus equi subsp. zooepidemicus]MCD3380844.1 thioesterase family protein [Streptococcus equi subsp. zooepidemicus]HEL0565277.1 thioesterase family protein [Streptococcus equi subsp. zooepidemicus]HEL0639522.1 thioesterase family protein [Streptococcus equi subsp. zooepidemicus]